MKNKIFLFLVCFLIGNALFSQESTKIVEVLSGRTGPAIFSPEEIDYVDIYGLTIDGAKFCEIFLKDGKLEVNVIYDALSSDANTLVCKLDKSVLVIFNNEELTKKMKKQNGLSVINQNDVNFSFLNKYEAEKKYGKKGIKGAIIINELNK